MFASAYLVAALALLDSVVCARLASSQEKRKIKLLQPLVTAENLTAYVNENNNFRQYFHRFALIPGKDRSLRSTGHNETLDWVKDNLSPDYWDISDYTYNTTVFPCGLKDNEINLGHRCEPKEVAIPNLIVTSKHHELYETNQGVLIIGVFSDSYTGTHGINSQGSALIGVLQVAQALQRYRITNPISFIFWSGVDYKNLLKNGPVAVWDRLKHHSTPDAFNALGDIKDIKAYLHVDTLGSTNGIRAVDGTKDFVDYFSRLHLPKLVYQKSKEIAGGQLGEIPVPWGAISSGFSGYNKTREQVVAFGGYEGPYDPSAGNPNDKETDVDLENLSFGAQLLAHAVADHGGSRDGIDIQGKSQGH